MDARLRIVLGAAAVLAVGTMLAQPAVLAQPAAATDSVQRVLDGCDVGGGGNDIQAMESSHDRGRDQLTVTLRLCADAEPAATYRLHIDHAAPFVEEAAATARCTTPADSVVTRGPSGHRGAGRSEVLGNRVIFTVPLDKLGVGPASEIPLVPLWANSNLGGTVDRAPNRETGDGCQHPQALTETLVQTRVVLGKLAWITQIPFEGSIGGVDDAENACRMEAHAAGHTGLFAAWFSDEDFSPARTIFGNPGPFTTLDGTLVAQNLADLGNCTKGASGTDCLLAPINRTIKGVVVPTGTLTWTGTLPNGTDSSLPPSSQPNCNGWTSFSGSDSGNGGSVDELGAGWSTGSIGPCNQERDLICLQIG
jgi:hypothetical protein